MLRASRGTMVEQNRQKIDVWHVVQISESIEIFKGENRKKTLIVKRIKVKEGKKIGLAKNRAEQMCKLWNEIKAEDSACLCV